jgi:hypothetical protein
VAAESGQAPSHGSRHRYGRSAAQINHQAALARIDQELENIDVQLMEVEILAPGGRNDRSLEQILRGLVRHSGAQDDLPGPELRERGRP